MNQSPYLADADRAYTYFDRRRKPNENLGGGRWVTVVRAGDSVYIDVHLSQAEAYAFIGLTGGDMDHRFRPPRDETGHRVAIGQGA